MFYELIYTRCQNGIDILSGKPLTSEGYKVYACSSELLAQGGIADSELLINAAQSKQSYVDVYSDTDSAKLFMDEAYLYYVPDFGKSFMIEFHPVHYAPERVGNYTKKPGNFLNQIFVGDFGNFYAWELFGDSSVWDAKLNDEPYYYSVNPLPLPMRELEPSGTGYTLDNIREFIAGGRIELLKKAVSFLLTQYALKPEERKYLVIRDTCSRNIELWIAAIECAFSPRMSAGLPFATRLNNYSSANFYTVKTLDGKYQPMMNFQDPNQRMRCRAMIVGVNMKDTSNNAPVMAFAARQFAVLDGVKMNAEFKADTSAEYFDVITRFDSEHRQFCLDFLQALDVKHPSPYLSELYRNFCALRNTDSLSPQELATIVSSLCCYDLNDTPTAHKIYSTLKENFGKITEHDFKTAVFLAEWVERNSHVMNDDGARENLAFSICTLMRDNIFSGRRELTAHILSGSFRKDAAAVVVSPDTLNMFASLDIAPSEGLYFCRLFAKCAHMIEHKITSDESLALVSRCISLCAADADKAVMAGLMDFLSGKDTNNRARARDIVLTCSSENGEFAVSYILDEEPEICASCSNAVKFCNLLNSKGMERFAVEVFSRGIRTVKNVDELISFAEKIRTAEYLSADEKTELFVALDSRVKPDVPSELAKAVQKYMPEGAVCTFSANAVGLLRMLSRKKRIEPISRELGKYVAQGFPCVTDEKFIGKFCDAFMSIKLTNDEDYLYMYSLLFRKTTPRSILLSVVYELVLGAKKHPEDWCRFLVYSSEVHREEAIDAVLEVLYEMSKPEKVLLQLSKATPRKNKAASDMFVDIEELAEKDIERRPKKGLLGKLAGFFLRRKDGD